MLAWSLRVFGLVFILLPAVAHSGVDCQRLFQRRYIDNTYYIVAFSGRERSPSEPQERSAKLFELEERMTAKSQDYVNRMSKDLTEAPPLIVFLTCDTLVSTGDLDLREIDMFARRNVVSAIWTSTEGGSAAVTHLSIPHFQRRTQFNRRQIEIVWRMQSITPTRSVEDWIYELERESVAQQALLAINVGFMALKASRLPLAKSSFCQARKNIRLMSPEFVRPGAQELHEIVSVLITEVIADIDYAANQKGTNLNSIQSVTLACRPT